MPHAALRRVLQQEQRQHTSSVIVTLTTHTRVLLERRYAFLNSALPVSRTMPISQIIVPFASKVRTRARRQSLFKCSSFPSPASAAPPFDHSGGCQPADPRADHRLVCVCVEHDLHWDFHAGAIRGEMVRYGRRPPAGAFSVAGPGASLLNPASAIRPHSSGSATLSGRSRRAGSSGSPPRASTSRALQLCCPTP